MKAMKDAKFLFIAANELAPWGGSELLWTQAAEKLARRGNEVRVSVKDWGKTVPQFEHLRLAGCRIFYRRSPSFMSRQVRKVFPFSESSLKHVRAVGEGVDLVVISQGINSDGLPWMEAAKAARQKYAVIAQAVHDYYWPDDVTVDRQAASYEGASRAYFVSQGNIDVSRRQFATPLRNAKVVRNPFNVRYDAQPAWPGEPLQELLLACVGRLEMGTKGQDLLLEVLSLPHWRERKVRVSLIGEGPNERVLRRRTEQLKLTSVEFLGYQDSIEEGWSRHHALVLPSRQEGMPLALVEAMLCGRPCIVTDVAGHKELVRDGINGFLAKAPTVELLEQAMNRAWDNRSRLREMGETAARDVRQWVSADPAEDFVRELESLLESSEKQS
jgi:glycosyltransferase involved in cell wall biosynthesis